jgi:protein XagA
MKKLGLVIIILALFNQFAYAGFPIGKGRFKIIPNYTLYRADGYWDNAGVYKAYANNGRFTSNYLAVNIGAGLSKDLDFVATIPFVVQTQTIGDSGKINSVANLGDISLGLSYYISHFNNDNAHLSLSGSLIIPGYQNVQAPFIGFGDFGMEAKVAVSGTTEKYYRNPYYDIEAGFRQFFNVSGPSQVFLNISAGIPVSEQVKINGSFNTLNSSSTLLGFDQFNLTANRNFSYIRAAAGVAFVASKNVEIGFSLFKDLAGKNIGKGSGISLFGVIKF